MPVNRHTTARFLKLLFSLVFGKALLPRNLIDDFGAQQKNTAQRVTRALVAALEGELPPLVQTIFDQWATFFGEVSGYQEGSARLKDKPELERFARGMGLDPARVYPPGFSLRCTPISLCSSSSSPCWPCPALSRHSAAAPISSP